MKIGIIYFLRLETFCSGKGKKNRWLLFRFQSPRKNRKDDSSSSLKLSNLKIITKVLMRVKFFKTSWKFWRLQNCWRRDQGNSFFNWSNVIDKTKTSTLTSVQINEFKPVNWQWTIWFYAKTRIGVAFFENRHDELAGI
jgi:hypothetical protein